MSDTPKTGSTGGPPKNPKIGLRPLDAEKARDVAAAAAAPSVAQGLQSVMAVIGEKYDPSASGAGGQVATPAPPAPPASASKLTDKIDAARLQQGEGSSVTQGLQSIMAVIGENYEEEPKPVEIAPPTARNASANAPVLKANLGLDPAPAPVPAPNPGVASPPPPPASPPGRDLITPAPQDTRNDVATSAISDLLPLLTEDEQDISQSQVPAARAELEISPPTHVVATATAAGSTITDLLNQLKSDISSLEQGSLSSRQQFNMPAVIDSASAEVKTLLADLQGDISALRSENSALKSQFKIPTTVAAQGSEVAALLSQLQGDITGLRQENDTLKNQYGIVPGGGGELSGLLAQLQGDISGLRKENDSFKAYYDVPEGRRGTSIGQAFLMTVGLLALVGGATVGGMYYANSINDQNNENLLTLLGLQKENNQKVAALEAAVIAEKTAAVAPKKATPKVAAVAPAAAPAPTPPALPKIVVKRPKLETAEVQALLTDAQNLIDLGDLVSARQMLEYAMSQQSAEAAYRLAQTFDPLHLATMASVLSVEPSLTRAKVLYYSAARQGHQAAAKRLAELRRTPGN